MATELRTNHRKNVLLLAANLLAAPILAVPAYGFIGYMDLWGVPKFVAVAWVGIAVAAAVVWPRVSSARPFPAYALVLVAAYAASTIAWAIALHKLYADPSLYGMYKWVEHASLLGGLYTAAYWLPASIVNFLVLRKRAA